jgi:hypothetical protein
MRYLGKKILAREILIFLSSILLIFLIYLGLCLYNYTISTKIEKSEIEIKSLQIELDSLTEITTIRLTDKNFPFALSIYLYLHDLNYIQISQEEYIKQIDNYLFLDTLFLHFSDLNSDLNKSEFIDSINKTKEKSKVIVNGYLSEKKFLEKIDKAKLERKVLIEKSALTENLNIKMGWIYLGILIFIYPIRWIYKIMKWAIVTLKEN